MTLTIYWLNPAIHAACGYKALYRRKGASAYTEIDTSGSTSGSTSLSFSVSAPASYEGYIQSDCCSSSVSTGDPFGVNGYGTFHVSVAIQVSPLHYIATITSGYANPHAHILTGTFTSSSAGTVSFTATYPANSTSSAVILSNAPVSANETVSNVIISAIAPVFNNGGALQQNDLVNTPSYFELYTSGATSGVTTWHGDPMTLPSFTLDTFNVTETDISGNVIAGNLICTWAQPYVYGGGISPYNEFTIDVKELAGSTVLGTTTLSTAVNGLRSITIAISKGSFNITSSVAYKADFLWGDGLQYESKAFYLPLF